MLLASELVIAFAGTIILYLLSYVPVIRATGSIARLIAKYCPPFFFFAGIWSIIFSNFVSFGYIGQEAALFALVGLGGWCGYTVAKIIQIKWLSNVVT